MYRIILFFQCLKELETLNRNKGCTILSSCRWYWAKNTMLHIPNKKTSESLNFSCKLLQSLVMCRWHLKEQTHFTTALKGWYMNTIIIEITRRGSTSYIQLRLVPQSQSAGLHTSYLLKWCHYLLSWLIKAMQAIVFKAQMYLSIDEQTKVQKSTIKAEVFASKMFLYFAFLIFLMVSLCAPSISAIIMFIQSSQTLKLDWITFVRSAQSVLNPFMHDVHLCGRKYILVLYHNKCFFWSKFHIGH